MEKLLEKLREQLGADVFNADLAEYVKGIVESEVETRMTARESEIMLEAEETAAAKYESEMKAYNEVLHEELQKWVGSHKRVLEEQNKEQQTHIVESLSDYLDAQLSDTIPAELLEAQAELSVYKPVVLGLRKLMAENFINADTEQAKVLEDARLAIMKLRENKSQLISNIVSLKKKLEESEKSKIVNTVCEELTESQADRFRKLSTPFSAKELLDEQKWQTLVDMVVEEKRERSKPATRRTTDTRRVVREGVDDLSEGTEIADDPSRVHNRDPVMELYRKELKRQQGSSIPRSRRNLREEDEPKEGDACSKDGKDGKYVMQDGKLVCEVTESWSRRMYEEDDEAKEGDSCSKDGKDGKYVMEDGQLVCKIED